MQRKKLRSNLLQAAIVISILTSFMIPGVALQQSLEKEHTSMPHLHPTIIATTIYVDDSNTAGPWDGSQDHPYRYIQDGIDHATAGDTVFVFNGTYPENIDIPKAILLTGEHPETTILDGTTTESVIRITAHGVTIKKFTIKNSGSNPNHAGIYILTQNNIITENILIKNSKALHFLETANTVFYNTFIENTLAAEGLPTNTLYKNYWDGYSGTDANEDGIGDTPYEITSGGLSDTFPLMHPYGSITNINTKKIFFTIQHAISDCTTTQGHTIFVKKGLYTEHITIHKSLTLIGQEPQKTVIDGRTQGTVVFICANDVSLSGFTVQNSGTDITNAGIIIQSDKTTITNTILTNNFHGIYLKLSADHNTITTTLITNNTWNGIYIKSSAADGNTICENIIKNNGYAGIGISDSSYNKIYHNTFIGNTHQAYDTGNNLWDNGHPSGGNYWSDYTGIDANGDGIGDTPYAIPNGINRDRYPLIEPYGSGDTTAPTISIVSPTHGLYLRGHQLFESLLKKRILIIGDITIQVAATDSRSGINRVEFYLDNNPTPVKIAYQEPYQWIWTKNPKPLKHKHIITVVAFDNAGNFNMAAILVRKYF
ncbi:MAG: NosD domain-containing protein [Candidatus Thermoplasmatota archaeon]